MKMIKGSNVLRAELRELEKEIERALVTELLRIGRTVKMEEFPYVPFTDEVDIYILAIRLDDSGAAVFDTSFNDVEEKFLTDFITDREITHHLLIDLLDMLKSIAGRHGQPPSVLKAVSAETIMCDEDRDNWICNCGNYAALHGFYACDADGNLIEPAGEWDNLYRCDQCGRVIDQRNHKVIGINLNPTREED